MGIGRASHSYTFQVDGTVTIAALKAELDKAATVMSESASVRIVEYKGDQRDRGYVTFTVTGS